MIGKSTLLQWTNQVKYLRNNGYCCKQQTTYNKNMRLAICIISLFFVATIVVGCLDRWNIITLNDANTLLLGSIFSFLFISYEKLEFKIQNKPPNKSLVLTKQLLRVLLAISSLLIMVALPLIWFGIIQDAIRAYGG